MARTGRITLDYVDNFFLIFRKIYAIVLLSKGGNDIQFQKSLTEETTGNFPINIKAAAKLTPLIEKSITDLDASQDCAICDGSCAKISSGICVKWMNRVVEMGLIGNHRLR